VAKLTRALGQGARQGAIIMRRGWTEDGESEQAVRGVAA
jgi:hypothetical protein